MRRRVSGIGSVLVVAAAFAAACNSATDADASGRGPFQVVLQVDTAQQYGDIQPQCDLYCLYAVADTSRDSLTVELRADSAIVEWHGIRMAGADTVSLDATFAAHVSTNGGDSGCLGFYVRGRDANDTISGLWTEQMDCHGRTRWGTFTGRR